MEHFALWAAHIVELHITVYRCQDERRHEKKIYCIERPRCRRRFLKLLDPIKHLSLTFLLFSCACIFFVKEKATAGFTQTWLSYFVLRILSTTSRIESMTSCGCSVLMATRHRDVQLRSLCGINALFCHFSAILLANHQRKFALNFIMFRNIYT